MLWTTKGFTMVDQYVVPHPEGWAVRAATSRTVLEIFDDKDAAINFAHNLAKEQESALFVRDVTGTTTKEESFRPTSYQLENHSIMVNNEYQERHDED